MTRCRLELFKAIIHAWSYSELELMETVTLRQAPRRFQVLVEILDLFDGFQESSIDRLGSVISLEIEISIHAKDTYFLFRLPLLRYLCRLLALAEEFSLL
jgi:hypothetical protein